MAAGSCEAGKGKEEATEHRLQLEASEKRPERVWVESDAPSKAAYHCEPRYGIFQWII